MNKLTNDAKKSMTSRIITAIVLLIISIPCILFGNWFFAIFVAVALFFACHEFTNAPKNKSYKLILHLFVYLITYSFVFWIFIKNNLNEVGWNISKWSFSNSFNQISVSVIAIAIGFLVLFFLTLNKQGFDISDATYLCTMMVFVGLSIQSLMFLRYHPGYAFGDANILDISNSKLLFYVILTNFLSDTGAYFTGILFGKHKMNERISPKKTWEGFVGGVVLSAVGGFLFAFLFAKHKNPILPILNVDHWYNILIISLVIPLTANLGDFIFSSIKRNYKIKDFGTILKGHGGVLDRVDSLLVTSLVVTIIIIFMEHEWNFLI